MCQERVGANLVFARRTTIDCEHMSEAIVSTSLLNIGLIPVFARRANTRFAPTLVFFYRFDTGFCPEGEHKVRPYIGFAYRFDTGFCLTYCVLTERWNLFSMLSLLNQIERR